MKMLPLSVTALALLVACSPTPPTPGVTETERDICEEWLNSLPTRSRRDTSETISEISRAYNVAEAICKRPVFPR